MGLSWALVNTVSVSEVYLIRRKDLFDPRFFLLNWDLRGTLQVAQWTPHEGKARMFTTEEDVETFKAENLKHQPCEIIRIKN